MWLKKLMRWMMTLSVIVLAAGCAVKDGDYCDIARPIWWDSTQELDDTPTGITRQIAKHNETWLKVCQ
ncbi:hypothetical protein [Castellaniella sp.]|uniref:hypothetical protein n=1 Tax=Castellaniella sp. TaxID=1955812 RepID=UPI002AFF7A4C|nr:hypothetical protein [Castellaniella sp.]